MADRMVELMGILRGVMPDLDAHLEAKHGRRVGVALFIFELGSDDGTSAAFGSNGDLEGVTSLIRQWLARAEVGVMVDPPGPSGRA